MSKPQLSPITRDDLGRFWPYPPALVLRVAVWGGSVTGAGLACFVAINHRESGSSIPTTLLTALGSVGPILAVLVAGMAPLFGVLALSGRTLAEESPRCGCDCEAGRAETAKWLRHAAQIQAFRQLTLFLTAASGSASSIYLLAGVAALQSSNVWVAPLSGIGVPILLAVLIWLGQRKVEKKVLTDFTM